VRGRGAGAQHAPQSACPPSLDCGSAALRAESAAPPDVAVTAAATTLRLRHAVGGSATRHLILAKERRNLGIQIVHQRVIGLRAAHEVSRRVQGSALRRGNTFCFSSMRKSFFMI
jgi:hypothetical protein